MRRKVYICSPLHGNIKENLEKAKQYTRYALECGMAPVTPHFYIICLDNSINDYGDLILKATMSLLWFCDELWVFGDEISEEMLKEISFCEIMRIPIKKFGSREIKKLLGEWYE